MQSIAVCSLFSRPEVCADVVTVKHAVDYILAQPDGKNVLMAGQDSR